MTSRRTTWWLALDGDKRIAITAGGLVFGRAAHCDLVSTDPAVSRDQAIVVAGAGRPSLIVLGRGRTRVAGEDVEHERELAAGDVIELPGLRATVVAEDEPVPATTTSWVVHSRTGGLFGVARSPFVIGGSATADLRMDGWPAEVLRLVIVDRLHVHAVEPIEVDGRALAVGDVEALVTGSMIAYRDEVLEVIAGGALGADTTSPRTGEPVGAEAVRLEYLPRGGRLTVRVGGQERTVYLAEKRCDLIALLVRPPAPYAAGQLIPDDAVLPRVWPGKTMARVDLNVLLHRTRHDLIRAGLDGPLLLPRADGGNATRFLLVPGARVELV